MAGRQREATSAASLGIPAEGRGVAPPLPRPWAEPSPRGFGENRGRHQCPRAAGAEGLSGAGEGNGQKVVEGNRAALLGPSLRGSGTACRRTAHPGG